jgi:circadian clock protein KaiB
MSGGQVITRSRGRHRLTCMHGEKMKTAKTRRKAKKDKNTNEKACKSKYILRLYVTGMTEKSSLAIQNIRQICEDRLEGHYNLEVIDIYQQPALARGDQIIAAPTLVKKLPLPLRRFIGDLSDREKVLLGLDLQSKQ